MVKFYPEGQITPYGAELLKERVEPTILYTSHDGGIQWAINGGLAPQPGIQAGAVLADGAQGLHPPFSQVEQKGARQDGVSHQHSVFDGAEIELPVELTAPANHNNPEQAAAQMRTIIRDWVASFDPNKPGRLDWVNPDTGRWWCRPRLFRSPPDRQFKAQARRLRQRYTWTVRNDDAFWRGTDSVCVFDAAHTNLVQVGFPQDYVGSLGPQWDTTTIGSGTGELQAEDGAAVWVPGTGEVETVNVLQGANDVQVVAASEGEPTAGDFTLIFDPDGTAEETNDIAFDAPAEDVQTELEDLPSVGAGNVLVTGPDGGPYTVEFINTLGAQDIPLMDATSNLTGSDPVMTVGQGATGAPGWTQADQISAVTITTGPLYQPPGQGDTGTPGDPGAPGVPTVPNIGASGATGDPGAPNPATPSLNIFGWFDGTQTDGVQGNISNGVGILYSIIGGVKTVIGAAVNIVGTIANAAITLVSEVIQIGVGLFQTVVSLVVNGIKLITGIISGLLGAFFEVIGFGTHTGNSGGQQVPPPVTGVNAGPRTLTAAGQLVLTNFGDQDAWPRYLCYGPGIFRIANGPDSTQMIEFGPLVDGQIALLTTLPRLRGVVDLTPNTASLAVTPQFDNFFQRLISLATNNNTPPLLEMFQSLFGARPPQGVMYPLLQGRFSNPVPAKPTGDPPAPSKIRCEILNGTPASRIVGALTPLRRWPE